MPFYLTSFPDRKKRKPHFYDSRLSLHFIIKLKISILLSFLLVSSILQFVHKAWIFFFHAVFALTSFPAYTLQHKNLFLTHLVLAESLQNATRSIVATMSQLFRSQEIPDKTKSFLKLMFYQIPNHTPVPAVY